MSTDTAQLIDKCKKTIEAFKKELSRMRTGRANSSLLEGINVDYYGTMTPLIQLANINTPEPRLLTLQVYDRNALEPVLKAIRSSELGLNPSNEGNLVRVVLPSLTEERRKDLIKKLKEAAEDSRVTVRNHRRESIDLVKSGLKDRDISEDDSKRAQEDIQKVTDQYIKEIDTLLASKEKEMLEV